MKGTEPLAAGPVNASCFSCLNVPLPMTVSVDLSEKHPNVFTEEAVGPRSMRLLFRGGKGRRRTAELVVFRSRGFSTSLVVHVTVAFLSSSGLLEGSFW